ncbi:hypothetical protein [Candidatus Finniella inopinata]|uniref:Leucine-rich repeat domain-containing protein n=1 Tax=Candidatus Finniella inopinata TaxID=1696036 RepID=A0A4Q7DKL0_9PROT|nr:hypothetical protein [Candidatus Finniella inopinata]RZI46859.1 hypothetical protein EQU50_01140 [Candidatus Finniella inopinata]
MLQSPSFENLDFVINNSILQDFQYLINQSLKTQSPFLTGVKRIRWNAEWYLDTSCALTLHILEYFSLLGNFSNLTKIDINVLDPKTLSLGLRYLSKDLEKLSIGSLSSGSIVPPIEISLPFFHRLKVANLLDVAITQDNLWMLPDTITDLNITIANIREEDGVLFSRFKNIETLRIFQIHYEVAKAILTYIPDKKLTSFIFPGNILAQLVLKDWTLLGRFSALQYFDFFESGNTDCFNNFWKHVDPKVSLRIIRNINLCLVAQPEDLSCSVFQRFPGCEELILPEKTPTHIINEILCYVAPTIKTLDFNCYMGGCSIIFNSCAQLTKLCFHDQTKGVGNIFKNLPISIVEITMEKVDGDDIDPNDLQRLVNLKILDFSPSNNNSALQLNKYVPYLPTGIKYLKIRNARLGQPPVSFSHLTVLQTLDLQYLKEISPILNSSSSSSQNNAEYTVSHFTKTSATVVKGMVGSFPASIEALWLSPTILHLIKLSDLNHLKRLSDLSYDYNSDEDEEYGSDIYEPSEEETQERTRFNRKFRGLLKL